MVDQQHAGVVLVADGAHDGRELRHLGLRQPRRGLVHEHEPRLGRERPRDAEPPLVAVRERARRTRPRTPSSPSRLEQLVRPRRAPRAAARRRRAPRPRRSRARTARGRSGCAGTSGRARPGPAGAALQPVIVALAELDAPALGASKPVRTLTSVDLPAPFGPIRPTTSWRCSSSVTPSSARTPCERARDGGGPEGLSGPPLRLRCERRAPRDVLDLRDDLGPDGADVARLVVLDPDHAVLPSEDGVELAARS